MPWLYQRNSVADKDRHYVDDKFVNLAFVQERSDDAGAAHHPDVLAGLGPYAPGELLDGLSHKLRVRGKRFRRIMGKDVVLYLCARRSERTLLRSSSRFTLAGCELSKYGLVCLSSPDDCVDGFIECVHTIVVCWLGPIEPVDIAVRPRDVPIGAGGDVNDDLSFLLHLAWVRPIRSRIRQLYLKAAERGLSRGEELELYPLLRAYPRVKRVLDVSHLGN